jgi:hypothetical protein
MRIEIQQRKLSDELTALYSNEESKEQNRGGILAVIII